MTSENTINLVSQGAIVYQLLQLRDEAINSGTANTPYFQQQVKEENRKVLYNKIAQIRESIQLLKEQNNDPIYAEIDNEVSKLDNENSVKSMVERIDRINALYETTVHGRARAAERGANQNPSGIEGVGGSPIDDVMRHDDVMRQQRLLGEKGYPDFICLMRLIEASLKSDKNEEVREIIDSNINPKIVMCVSLVQLLILPIEMNLPPLIKSKLKNIIAEQPLSNIKSYQHNLVVKFLCDLKLSQEEQEAIKPFSAILQSIQNVVAEYGSMERSEFSSLLFLTVVDEDSSLKSLVDSFRKKTTPLIAEYLRSKILKACNANGLEAIWEIIHTTAFEAIIVNEKVCINDERLFSDEEIDKNNEIVKLINSKFINFKKVWHFEAIAKKMKDLPEHCQRRIKLLFLGSFAKALQYFTLSKTEPNREQALERLLSSPFFDSTVDIFSKLVSGPDDKNRTLEKYKRVIKPLIFHPTFIANLLRQNPNQFLLRDGKLWTFWKITFLYNPYWRNFRSANDVRISEVNNRRLTIEGRMDYLIGLINSPLFPHMNLDHLSRLYCHLAYCQSVWEPLYDEYDEIIHLNLMKIVKHPNFKLENILEKNKSNLSHLIDGSTAFRIFPANIYWMLKLKDRFVEKYVKEFIGLEKEEYWSKMRPEVMKLLRKEENKPLIDELIAMGLEILPPDLAHAFTNYLNQEKPHAGIGLTPDW